MSATSKINNQINDATNYGNDISDKAIDTLTSEMNSAEKEAKEWSKYAEGIFDAIITLNIKELNNYAILIFKKITTVLTNIGNYLYNFIQTTLTTYSAFVTMLFFIIFVAILLFSRNKFGDILVLSYFYTGFLLTGLFVASINWMIILYNKGKNLVMLLYEFLTLLLQEAPLTLENYWTMIKNIFWIITTIIGICFTLLIFFWTAIAVEFLTRLANVLFIAIDENNEDSKLDIMEIISKVYGMLKDTFNSVNGEKE